MHDITDLEERGVPGAFVATVEFQDAASAQSRALGFSPRAVFVPHPIQDRTDAEIQTIADEVAAAIEAALRN